MFHVPEKFRVTDGAMLSTEHDGNNGHFIIPYGPVMYFVIASDGMGWEHVSVHIENRERKQYIPTWPEMNYIKDMFWDAEDAVMQLHPPKSEYINNHSLLYTFGVQLE